MADASAAQPSTTPADVTAPSVKITFRVDGDAQATNPLPILAEVSTVTVGLIRHHALRAVASHPRHNVRITVDGKELKGHDDSPFAVPDDCVIRVPRKRTAKDVGEGDSPKPDDEEADAAAKEDESTPKPEAAAGDAEDGDKAAPPPVVEDDTKPADASEGAAAGDGAEKKEGAGKKKKDKIRRPPRERLPLRDWLVVITVTPLREGALPADRANLLRVSQAVNLCHSCNKVSLRTPSTKPETEPVLLDCGHMVCRPCFNEHQQQPETKPEADAAAADGGDHAAEAGVRRPRYVACPVCGYHTLAPANFVAGSAVSTSAKDAAAFQVPVDQFGRSVRSVVRACSIVRSCEVCGQADAVGRCSVEQLSMCEKCHEEHLPHGALRNLHSLLRFGADDAAAAVLCEQPDHRKLPVSYFCIQHGRLGCHMCLKETSEHAKCDVITDAHDLAAIATHLRVAREAEVARVQNQCSQNTRRAWTSYTRLRRDYDQQVSEIDRRAAAYKQAIDEQKAEALKVLETVYTDGLQRWERRIAALDGLRGRGANVGAVLDGHRKLPSHLLLHAEMSEALSLGGEEAAVPEESIAHLSTRFAPAIPPLFDVNGHRPGVAAADSQEKIGQGAHPHAKHGGGKVDATAARKAGADAAGAAPKSNATFSARSYAVGTQQTSLAMIARQWKTWHEKHAASAAAAVAATAAASADSSSTPKRKTTAGGSSKAPKTLAHAAAGLERAAASRVVALPKLVNPLHQAAAAPELGSPKSTASNDDSRLEELVDFASVTKGPKELVLLVDCQRAFVLCVAFGKNVARVVHLLGGTQETYLFKSPDETVTVNSNRMHLLSRPVHAFHHERAGVIVVCDAGNDRVVMFPDHCLNNQSSAPVASAEGLLKGPAFAASDPNSNAILVCDSVRVYLMDDKGVSKQSVARWPTIPARENLSHAVRVAVTRAAGSNAFIAYADRFGDVAFLQLAPNKSTYTTIHVQNYVASEGALLDPVAATQARRVAVEGAAKGDGHVRSASRRHGGVVALVAHPDLNAVLMAAETHDAAKIRLVLVGMSDHAAHADPVPAAAAATTAPERGGRGGRGGKQQPSGHPSVGAAQPPASKKTFSLEVVKAVTVDLGEALGTADKTKMPFSSISIQSVEFETSTRIIVGVCKRSTRSWTDEAAGLHRVAADVSPTAFVVVHL